MARQGKAWSAEGSISAGVSVSASLRTGLIVAVLIAGAAIPASLFPALAAAAGKPQIASLWVRAVGTSGATLKAEIDPNGFAATYHFEYVTDAAYSVSGFSTAVKTQDVPIVEPLEVFKTLSSVLAPATTYHYRAVATNAAGTTLEPEHTFTTEEVGGGFRLPDNRGWEMVSPVDKNGGAVAAPGELFGGGDLQAAAGGGAVTYGSAAAFGASVGAPPSSQYISRRISSGWTIENISSPLESAAYGDEPDGAPYRVLSADLSRALLFGGLACRGGLSGCPVPNPVLPGSGAPTGYMAYYLRDGASGALPSLLEAADVAHSAVLPAAFEVALAAASPDLSHVVLSTCAKLTADATEVVDGSGGCNPKESNLYEWSAGGLSLLNLLPGGATGTPGAQIGASVGAISQSGARVYWSVGGNLYLREGAQTEQVDKPPVGGGGAFQVAAADGSVAFFTKAGHLYRYDAVGKAAADLTPSGGVQGVLGASSDGTSVYFQDSAGLRLWHSGETTTVADGADATLASDYPPASATARVSADGLHLAFLSTAELTHFDNTDADTKQPDVELFVYGPPPVGGAAKLVCASCNPTGERPKGSASIPGTLVNGSTLAYRSRPLSADGSRLFFDTNDGLSGKDANERRDVYEWEAEGAGGCGRTTGCISLISDGTLSGGQFVDASEDGDDVYFLTNNSLVAWDPGSVDLYDARVDGGLPGPPKDEICVGDACQGLPGSPEDPTPGTLAQKPGNPQKQFFGPRQKKRLGTHHRKKHHKRHRKGKRAGGRGR